MEMMTAAFGEMGLRPNEVNSNIPEAVVNNQFAIMNNSRLSSNSAFLKPIRHRKNLKVITGATVTRILIDRSSKTVDGVIYETEKGKERAAYVKRELVLSAGAINNVKILLLSGIGPRRDLLKFNITAVHELPVGYNYQDQVSTGGLSFALNDATEPTEKQIINEFKTWFDNRSGLLVSRGIGQISAFVQLYEHQNAPDVEFVLDGNFIRSDKFLLTNVSVPSSEEHNLPLTFYNIINIYPVLLKPKSKGKVTLNKKNPKYGRPIIQANFLKENEDLETLVDSIDIALQLLDTRELKKADMKLAPVDLFPCDRLRNREQWSCVARHYTRAVNNPVGTCRMGTNSSNSVVDYELRVHGFENMRVIDASIMPSHVRGGIFAPAVMIAEKGSKMLIDNWKETKGHFYTRK